MPRIGKFLDRFLIDESGISSVEYAMLLAFVGAGIILGAGELSEAVQGELDDAAACIRASIASASNC